jgi:hypothetical protein
MEYELFIVIDPGFSPSLGVFEGWPGFRLFFAKKYDNPLNSFT